ncbi:helitron_like_N domain-containing protein [Trichonephila clavipes]|nr:helitron_like_N domain-containing protein [Trichonephila clavipes]
MQIRRLRYDDRCGIIGQVINAPVEVDTIVQQLPHQLDEDQAFNVNIKRNMIHKSTYLSGVFKELLDQRLYKLRDGSIRDPSTNPLGKPLGYQFLLFTTNPSEEENHDMQVKLLYIFEVF